MRGLSDPVAKPPQQLIEAFRAVELAEHTAALMIEEGFDAEAMRVLAAFQHAEQLWSQPKKPCPTVMPTPGAWAWLVSGWTVDFFELSRAAGVSEATARGKLDMLRGNHLIYPDGTMSKWATAALRSHVANRISGGGKKKRSKAAASPDDAN